MSDITNPLIGQYIGHYQIKEVLSQQDEFSLYKAFDARTSMLVLVKKFFPKDLSSDQLENFNQYAIKLEALSHPNIVKVLDFGVDSGRPYLVMQYIGGSSLENLDETTMPWQEIVKIFLPVTHALHTAHISGIYHQNLQPGSIHFSEGGNVMLSDFGIPERQSSPGIQPETNLDDARFLSPEQMQGNPADARSNIYSAGCILYRLATGRFPFDADSPATIMQKHLSEPAVLPREINPQVPEGLQSLILRATSKSPADRFPDMAALGAALQQLRTFEAQKEKPENVVQPEPTAVPLMQSAVASATRQPQSKTKKHPVGKVILTILIALVAVLVIVSLLLSLGGAFFLSKTIQTTFKETDFTFYNVNVERTETMTEKQARIALNKSLEFENDLLTNFSVDFQSPDIALLGAQTKLGKVSLQVEITEVDGKPNFKLQKLNKIPLLFVGNILSRGINNGLSAAIEDEDFSIEDLKITNSRISYDIAPK